MPNKAAFIGGKRLVGSMQGKSASAERFEVSGRKAWMIFENGRPEGVEPSWDKAADRLRAAGYSVKSETRKH